MQKFKVTFFIFSTSLLFFSDAFAQVKTKAQSNQKPNIIFILTDDLGWGDLGVFYQNQRAKENKKSEPWGFTPNLDKLAAQGAMLTNHYCSAPVCAPSRASILLGQSQGHANVRDNQFDKELPSTYTMASTLRQLGYATAAIGKWGLQGGGEKEENTDWPAHPLNRGFDYYLGYIRHRDGHEHYPKEGVYRGSKQVWENRIEITDGLDKCYTGDLFTAAAKRWILAHKKSSKANNPFFMYLAYDTPHAVLELPTQQYPAGGGVKGGMQWLGKAGQMINTASGTVDSWTHPDYAKATYDHDKNTATPEVAWPETYQRYATSVRRTDDHIGDLLKLLQDLKIDQNTLIVFTSDNGPSIESYLPDSYVPNNPDFFNSFGPFDGIKRDVLEGGVRVPTIASWPARIPANQTVTKPTANYDWLPTFTDAAGVPAPARVDGVSLLPTLTQKGKQQAGVVYVEYYNNGTSPDFAEFQPQHRNRKRGQMQLIRFGDLVGVRYDIKSHTDNFEIYNVMTDPQQANNLAKTADMESMQKQMKDRVLQVRRPDESAKRPYDKDLVAAVADKQTKAGVYWQTYAGTFPWLPQVAGLVPTASGQGNSVRAAPVKMANGVTLVTGYLKVPTDGEYTVYVTTNSESVLRLHEALLIESNQKGSSELAGKIKLKAGMHPFRFYYLNKGGSKPQFDFKWEGPGIAKQSIPANVFWQNTQARLGGD